MKLFQFYWGTELGEFFYLYIDADYETVKDIVKEVGKLIGTSDYNSMSDQEILEDLLERRKINFKGHRLDADYEIPF